MPSWVQNRFSRGEIDRAGETLRRGLGDNADAVFLEYLQAYNVMNMWRASHAFPLNTLQMTLRRRSKSLNKNYVTAQRLKRAPSVISKLRRNPNMNLSRMQDLGGCRAILGSVEDVYKLREVYRLSRDRHSLGGEKDYIIEPRPSGYRGYHIIYKYQSDRNIEFNGHRIEIQLRTRIQHAWATAVEIAGTFTGTSLKSSIGPREWLEFFKLSSSAFSILEDTCRPHENLSDKEIKEQYESIGHSIDAFNRLRGFSTAHRVIQERKSRRDSHFILFLDLENMLLTVQNYSSIGEASEQYATLEKQIVDDPSKDVVLVAAENVESVASAYPNYFADTHDFLSFSSTVLGN